MPYPKQKSINAHHLVKTTVHIKLDEKNKTYTTVDIGKTKMLTALSYSYFDEWYIDNPLPLNKYQGKPSDKPAMPNIIWKHILILNDNDTLTFPEKYLKDFTTVMCLAGFEVSTHIKD